MAKTKTRRASAAGKSADAEVAEQLAIVRSDGTSEPPDTAAAFAQESYQQEAKRRYEREDEALAVEWCRKERGSLGGPHDPTFGVMLAKGGITALLMRADLSTQEGADHFFHTHTTINRSRPSLEQLRTARAIGEALSTAILAGNDTTAWERVKRAHVALFVRNDELRKVLSIIGDLRGYHDRETEAAARRLRNGRQPHAPAPGTGIEFRAFIALQSLANVDSRFANVCVCELVTIVRNEGCGPKRERSPKGIAVQLTAKCGAFGLTPHADGKDRTRHIRDAYDAAEREARELATTEAQSPTE